ncbi:MAG: phosphoesterase PA-phosphatase related protein, partial [Conexibacter sp.]|nr:phosphoesterase PA-phosphatase related protein [Conexibacter sp.]
MPRTHRLPLLLAAVVTAVVAAPAAHAQSLTPNPSSDPVALWFDATDQVVVQAGYPAAGNLQVTGSRTWAIAWGAADTAIAALPKDLTPAGREIATRAALSAAVHDALVELLPASKSIVDDARRRTLGPLPGSKAKELGKAAGRKAAADAVAARKGDGLDVSAVNPPFTPPPAALGVWRPTPPSFGVGVQSGQGRAKPFLVADVATKFVAPEPPALDSPTEIADLQEVDRVGSLSSTVRTPEQTESAKFWSQTSLSAFTQILRATIVGAGRPVAPRVKVVAVFNAATVDAQIAVYASKYKYLRWRPVTALSTDDKNPATPYDPAFKPLLATPLHPEYPSGHTGFAGAAEQALTVLVGAHPAKPITITSPATPGIYRTYSEWAQATQDNVDARVWSGIHLRSTDVAGAALGRTVAAAALKAAGITGPPEAAATAK